MSLKYTIQEWYDRHHANKYELKKYLIKDGKKHPFALICPGGAYWCVCSFVEGLPFMEELRKKGYAVFVLYYHVQDKARYPAPQEDVARALHDILDHAEEYNIDTEGYSIWGSSAGGHLAASFGTESMGYPKYHLPKPGALVLIYPVVTMGEKTHEGSRYQLLGENPTEEQIELTSVEKQVTDKYPPTFVWCGDADTCVPPANSHMLAAVLEEKGVAYEFVEYPGVDHGVGLGKGLACEPWFEKAVAFWENQRKIIDNWRNGHEY